MALEPDGIVQVLSRERLRVTAVAVVRDVHSAPARELLQMKYADGLTAAAIAGRLRRTADAVYQSLSRTHRALRECVERELGRTGRPTPGEVPS